MWETQTFPTNSATPNQPSPIQNVLRSQKCPHFASRTHTHKHTCSACPQSEEQTNVLEQVNLNSIEIQTQTSFYYLSSNSCFSQTLHTMFLSGQKIFEPQPAINSQEQFPHFLLLFLVNHPFKCATFSLPLVRFPLRDRRPKPPA